MSTNLFFDTVLADERGTEQATAQTVHLVIGQTDRVGHTRLPHAMFAEIRDRALRLFFSINGLPTEPANPAMLAGLDAHSQRTARYANLLARRLMVLSGGRGELSGLSAEVLAVATLFHDVGKIDAAMYDIVHEASELSPKERALVLMHPLRGAQVLRPLSAFYPDLAEGVLSHHERWDGIGYPRGLRGEEIPLAARIVAIADTYDVVTHGRRYRGEGRGSLADGQSALRAGRGTQFDPALVDLALEPRVLAALEGAVRTSHGPRIWRREGGRSRTVSGVPDITFRWRSEALEPLPRDPGR